MQITIDIPSKAQYEKFIDSPQGAIEVAQELINIKISTSENVAAILNLISEHQCNTIRRAKELDAAEYPIDELAFFEYLPDYLDTHGISKKEYLKQQAEAEQKIKDLRSM